MKGIRGKAIVSIAQGGDRLGYTVLSTHHASCPSPRYDFFLRFTLADQEMETGQFGRGLCQDAWILVGLDDSLTRRNR